MTAKKVDLPEIELPERPSKPQIKSEVLEKGGEYYVAYRVGDAMKLYEYLVRVEAYMEKADYRVKVLNELLKRLGGR
ncbi:MAG: hypothetical protein QW835_00265 [Candidatus Hadarchaeum sp.]